MLYTIPMLTIAFQALGNLFALTTGCQVPHNHVIAICNLPCQLLQKVNMQYAQRRLQAVAAKEFPFSSMPAGDSYKGVAETKIFGYQVTPFCSL